MPSAHSIIKLSAQSRESQKILTAFQSTEFHLQRPVGACLAVLHHGGS